MNSAYLHLLINHIPVILAPLGAIVAIIALLTRRRAVWLYAVATLTLSGLSAYPVMATGDAAGDFVKDNVPGVSRAAIEAHGDAGDTTMWVLLAAGAVAAYAWWRLTRKELTPLPLWLGVLIVVLGIASAGMVSYTAVKGGYIIHKEAHMTPPAPTPIPAH